jgi:Immunity protein 63
LTGSGRISRTAGEILDGIKRRVDRLARLIDAPEQSLPTYGRSEDMARPHIEVAGHHMSWVVVERGEEQERRATDDLDELLYWIFRSVISEMSSKFAAKHPVDGKEFRYPMFKRELELMGTLSPAWRSRLIVELGHLMREAGLSEHEMAGP